MGRYHRKLKTRIRGFHAHLQRCFDAFGADRMFWQTSDASPFAKRRLARVAAILGETSNRSSSCFGNCSINPQRL
jgi:hypothetical protein